MMASMDKGAADSSKISFFKTIFSKASNEDSSSNAQLSLEANPQELAVKLISVEVEYWNTITALEQKKSVLISNMEQSDDCVNDQFKDDLNKLNKEIEEYKSTKLVFLFSLQ